MDADRFDTLTRALQSSPTRRLTLGALTALGLTALLGDAETNAKKKGHKKGKKRKKKGLCTSVGDNCTFSVHPCCGGTSCCDPAGTGSRTCVPPAECCAGNICSSDSGTECSVGCTCQDRDSQGFGKCLPG